MQKHKLSFRAVTVILLLLVSILVASCSHPTTAPTEASSTDAVGGSPQTITFMITGSPEELAAYEALVADFKANVPGIEVTLSHVPEGGEFRQRLATMYAADAPPDVFLYNFRRLGTYSVEGAIHPVDALLDSSTVLNREDFYPVVIDAFTYNGQLQCMPQNLSSPVMYYNKALFDAAGLAYPQKGWTLADFVATAKALTLDTNGDGTTDQYGFGTAIETIRLAPFIWMNGGEILDDPVNPTRLTIDTPEAREAIQWFVDLQVKEGVAPDAVAEESSSSENRFLAGTLGMYMNSRVAVPTLRTITGFEWDAAPLPVGKNPASVLHSDGFCISAQAAKDPNHLAAVWKFVAHSLSETGQTLLAETGRTVPSMPKIAESEAYLQSTPPANNQTWLDAAEFMKAFPIHPSWNTLEGMLTEELERAFYGTVTVDEMIDAANKAAEEIINGN